MSKNYFTACANIEQAKRLYRKLARLHHPDNGGNEDEFKVLQNEFERFCNNASKDFCKNDTNKPHKDDEMFNAKRFMNIINKLIRIPEIEIEICGTWLWLTGNTYQYKDYLKEIGCRWSVGKKKWYWSESPYCKYSSRKSMSRIRAEYGSHKMNTCRKTAIE